MVNRFGSVPAVGSYHPPNLRLFGFFYPSVKLIDGI